MPWLTRVDSTGKIVQSWELGKTPVVFGRGDDVTVMIDDQQMSRRHFEIKFVNDSHILTDQNSTNGTWVNGRKVMHSYLKSGDQILAGQTHFRYQIGTATMLDMVQHAAGSTFKDEIKKIYKDADKS
jgi:pSer/pThr/pTyr-binding forkhead associated (FHA) protein